MNESRGGKRAQVGAGGEGAGAVSTDDRPPKPQSAGTTEPKGAGEWIRFVTREQSTDRPQLCALARCSPRVCRCILGPKHQQPTTADRKLLHLTEGGKGPTDSKRQRERGRDNCRPPHPPKTQSAGTTEPKRAGVGDKKFITRERESNQNENL